MRTLTRLAVITALCTIAATSHATHKARTLNDVMAAPQQSMAVGKSGKVTVATHNGTYIRVHRMDKMNIMAGVPVAAKGTPKGLTYTLKPGTYVADATESGASLGANYFTKLRLFTITAK